MAATDNPPRRRRLVAVALGATLLAAGTAHADQLDPNAAATALGAAFTAYDAGDLAGAAAALERVDPARLVNHDYYYWLDGQVLLLSGRPVDAERAFQQLGKLPGSRFAAQVPWKLADCAWEKGDHAGAAKRYQELLGKPGADGVADTGIARFRIGQAKAEEAKGAGARAAYRQFLLDDPGHPLAAIAEQRLVLLGATDAIAFSPRERITRAQNLTAEHQWDAAIAELSQLDVAQLDAGTKIARDYWLGTTLFKMRRRYGDAADLLLSVYPKLDGNNAEAMFHGARALSRADRDSEAIAWYHKVVSAYPSSASAKEAQFLSGWLEFNRRDFKAALAPLEESLRRYPDSKWVDDAMWFLGLSHYMLGEYDAARVQLRALGARKGALEAGKGQYWLARIDQQTGDAPAALAGYRAIVKRWPFSWYALLARARLTEAGAPVGPFGDDPAVPPRATGPALPDPNEALAADPLLARADELLAAGLGVDAGWELERGESGFLKRAPKRVGLATLLERYRRAGNYYRPWMLAVVHGERALYGAATGDARTWWEHAYPRAYAELVEKYQGLGDNPEGYLYSIMRKESGFNPHDLSYADAQGLLQMIPATTRRVARVLGIPYDDGRLYETEFNIETGAWYIGHLLSKFGSQIPIGAGSFNCGPRPVMEWLDENGDRPIDEFVELVSYTQTREYMKKVTENYARYRYLYANEDYAQPLVVDPHYRKDDITY